MLKLLRSSGQPHVHACMCACVCVCTCECVCTHVRAGQGEVAEHPGPVRFGTTHKDGSASPTQSQAPEAWKAVQSVRPPKMCDPESKGTTAKAHLPPIYVPCMGLWGRLGRME